MLVNGDTGAKILAETKVPFLLSSSDHWRILEDGRIVFTQVNADNSIDYYYLPAPSAPVFPTVIEENDLLYG